MLKSDRSSGQNLYLILDRNAASNQFYSIFTVFSQYACKNATHSLVGQQINMIKVIIIFFVALFITSLVQLSAIQHRFIKLYGWKVFLSGRIIVHPYDMYWRNLSVSQRIRLWLGIILFVAFILCFSAYKLLETLHL